MENFKITKVTVKNGEFSNLLHINLKVEVGDVEINISKVLSDNNHNDAELLKSIQTFATNEATAILKSQEKHRP